jgi:hypothetical protein
MTLLCLPVRHVFFYSENGGKSFGEVPKNSTIIYEVDLVEVK